MASPVNKHIEEDLPSPPDDEFLTAADGAGFHTNHPTSSWEIEVEEEEEDHSRDLFEIKTINTRMAPIKEDYESSLFSFEVGPNGENHVVYVGITKMSDESTDALIWTLKDVVGRAQIPNDPASNTVVYLIHVFPELRYIATPIGKLPISQANPEQKESFMMQERSKRRDFLQKFLDLCSASKVRVETILIESDMEAKAILDLIPILNIRKLILGTSKSSLRKARNKRGTGTVDHILQNAPEFCDVKIICEGKEVIEDQWIIESPAPSPRVSSVSSQKLGQLPRASSVGSQKLGQLPRANSSSPKLGHVQDHINDSTFACCFKPKAES